MGRVLRKRAWFVAVLAVFAAIAAPAANAGCPGQTAERPFLPWLDLAQYTLAPNGGFENGAAGWKLSGGARVVAGNEPFHVRAGGEDDARSLQLPAGSSATTPPICVRLLDPTLRYFAVNRGALLSRLEVEVLYANAFGSERSLRVDLLTLGARNWQPSLPILFLANLKSVFSLDSLTTTVRFRFTPENALIGGKGDWRLDDVYVDPFIMR
jgi:hypothetical protein